MSLKGYNLQFLKKDIPAGIIIALVSIPISIGYSLVAGLPPVYGLYGSLLPILAYGLITSSPRFVFGVDAAPAALVGGMLYSMGVAFQSDDAIRLVPVITLLTAAWILIARLIGLGKLVRFISSPVMGGFITGICCTIILMQIPKLYGGDSGRGELYELMIHIYNTMVTNVHIPSLILGAGTIAVIMISRKFIPAVPMSAVMMFIGAGITYVMHLESYGVKLLPSVRSGLPSLAIPDLSLLHGNVRTMMLQTLIIAIVIISETLLATNNFALKYDDRIDNNREIIAYAVGNLAGALVGCCPVNGSVSRSNIADQFGVKSQVMSISAAATMMLILLFGTGFIHLLPVPVLTGIVISALISSTEFSLAATLHKVDKTEWKIFYVVMFTVLIFGTIYGVLVGIIMSFVTVIIRASNPPRSRLGYIQEKDQFYPVDRTTGTREIKGALIYRFGGALFFANANTIKEEIDDLVTDDIKAVIIEASGITSIDVTAVERLMILYNKYKERGVKLFLTEHSGNLNDQLRAFGAEQMFKDYAIVPHIYQALKSVGITKPYELGDCEGDICYLPISGSAGSSQIAEFEWAYGDQAEARMEEVANSLADKLITLETVDDEMIREVERNALGSNWSEIDEEKFLDFLEFQLAHLLELGKIDPDKFQRVREKILLYHAKLDSQINDRNSDELDKIIKTRMVREEQFKSRFPAAYHAFAEERARHREILKNKYPEILERIKRLRAEGPDASQPREKPEQDKSSFPVLHELEQFVDGVKDYFHLKN
ncbi:SulP family inorganic anion transporter [Mogibacterium timidum]|nr:SulP family inorganic anion transporter [Mogibacterium timidum]NWO23678.1 STAS domain-containing protein [Mogibacterium timidum]